MQKTMRAAAGQVGKGETRRHESGAAFERGLNAGKQGNHKEAISQFTQAIKLNPTNTRAYYNRAWRFQKGDRGRSQSV
ncbi:hypothetical protein FACS189497_13960 [Betaproteobacteria bacterium]|nr:hypothetical protein FACS189497_13960 [Betaproteobacteria bacterium]